MFYTNTRSPARGMCSSASERVASLRQLDVTRGDRVLRVRPPTQRDPVPVDRDVRVVVRALGLLGDPVHEVDRPGEVVEAELHAGAPRRPPPIRPAAPCSDPRRAEALGHVGHRQHAVRGMRRRTARRCARARGDAPPPGGSRIRSGSGPAPGGRPGAASARTRTRHARPARRARSRRCSPRQRRYLPCERQLRPTIVSLNSATHCLTVVASVPDERDPAARTQHPRDLAERDRMVEPVERLGDRHDVDGLVRERDRLGGARKRDRAPGRPTAAAPASPGSARPPSRDARARRASGSASPSPPRGRRRRRARRRRASGRPPRDSRDATARTRPRPIRRTAPAQRGDRRRSTPRKRTLRASAVPSAGCSRAVALLLGLLVACSPRAAAARARTTMPFAYDADAPLALETGAQLADGRPLDVREISFASGEESGRRRARRASRAARAASRPSSTSTARAATERSSCRSPRRSPPVARWRSR